MLRALKAQLASIVVALVVVGAPLTIVLQRRHWIAVLLMTTAVTLVLGRFVGGLLVGWATTALSRGEWSKARRQYRLLWLTSIDGTRRRSCALSLAACDAAGWEYEAALARLSEIFLLEDEVRLRAVFLNLQAYCLGRLGHDLDLALQLSQECVALRGHVAGFRHTRGLLLLELGRFEEAIRDLEATWEQGPPSPLLESERCYDLGRLWKLRGHQDYAQDYFTRSLRACPDGAWARRARLLVGPRRIPSDSVASIL